MARGPSMKIIEEEQNQKAFAKKLFDFAPGGSPQIMFDFSCTCVPETFVGKFESLKLVKARIDQIRRITFTFS